MSLTMLSPFQEAQFQFQLKSSRRESPMIQLPKSLFPSVQNLLPVNRGASSSSSRKALPFPPPVKVKVKPIIVIDSLLENPVIWISRVCVYYALLKAGLVGSQSISSSSDSQGGRIPDLGLSKWLHSFQVTSEEKEATNKRKLVRNWHPTTKGTLKRSYRVPSKPEGRRLLKAIASLLSDDDEFLDATSHKGCQIRRESAHGESVCCNNVRALFDELPTPHLVLEITPFPAGPLSEKDYAKAGKLEKVLRSGTSI